MMNKELTHNTENSKDKSLAVVNYLDFINHYLRPNGKFGYGKTPLKQVATDLGYNTPSILSMILKGKRLPSRSFIDTFSQYFNLSSTEKEIFTLLVEHERLKGKGRDTSDIFQRLQKLSPEQNTDLLDVKWFKKVSGWHYTAIKNLIKTPFFIEDYDLIAKQLKGNVTPSQVKEAIEVLLELEVLKRDTSGQLKVIASAWRTPKGVSSTSLRTYHKGMIEQALFALKNENADRRYISGLTFQFDSSKKDEAVADIIQFLNDFNNKYFDENSKNISQLNIQFFKLNKELKGSLQ